MNLCWRSIKVHFHILTFKVMGKQKFIVRCNRAGVFYGEIKSRNGQEVEMTNVRNIWYWDGAASIMQLASEGVSMPKQCKFTVEVDSLVLLEAIQIIPCTEKAVKSIDAVAVWRD